MEVKKVEDGGEGVGFCEKYLGKFVEGDEGRMSGGGDC